MLRLCLGSAQACSPSAQACSPSAQVCSPSAQVKAAVAHVRRLKRNQQKGKLILSIWVFARDDIRAGFLEFILTRYIINWSTFGQTYFYFFWQNCSIVGFRLNISKEALHWGVSRLEVRGVLISSWVKRGIKFWGERCRENVIEMEGMYLLYYLVRSSGSKKKRWLILVISGMDS